MKILGLSFKTQQIIKGINNCIICQNVKDEQVKYKGLLQPLKPSSGPFEELTIDLVELPKSRQGNKLVLVVVDRFSKFVRLFTI